MYAKTATVVLPHEYINFVLTGRLASERGDASGTGWFDAATGKLDDAVLAAADPSGRVGDCLPSPQLDGHLTACIW